MTREDDRRPGGRTRPGIQSVEIAMRIVMQLVGRAAPAPLSELAKSVGMPPNKVHRYLVSLTRTRVTAQEVATGRYGLGPAAIAIGLAGLRMTDVTRQAFDMLPSLRDETGETAVIGVWTEQGPVITRIEESSRPVFMNVRVGSILPLTRTAVGQIYAAFLPSDVSQLLKTEMGEASSDQAASPFAAILARVRQDRLASVRGTLVPGVSALAAPVFDHRGRIVLSLGLLGQTDDLPDGVKSPAAQTLRNYATDLSKQLGFDPGGGDHPGDGS